MLVHCFYTFTGGKMAMKHFETFIRDLKFPCTSLTWMHHAMSDALRISQYILQKVPAGQ